MNNKPFMLKPAVQDYLWGGTKINDDFGLDLDVYPLAEAWMCSTHPDGTSFVPFYDCYLDELLKKHPNYLGSHPLQTTGGVPALPILVKLIDAKQDLSVQVHPNDEYALRNEGQWGKTEMWYVLSARSGSKLVYGFNQEMEAGLVREAVKTGRIVDYLNYIPVYKDDVFYIESGTVHAIGAGCLIAEIQESSNITYRLYDYDRTDRRGT